MAEEESDSLNEKQVEELEEIIIIQDDIFEHLKEQIEANLTQETALFNTQLKIEDLRLKRDLLLNQINRGLKEEKMLKAERRRLKKYLKKKPIGDNTITANKCQDILYNKSCAIASNIEIPLNKQQLLEYEDKSYKLEIEKRKNIELNIIKEEVANLRTKNLKKEIMIGEKKMRLDILRKIEVAVREPNAKLKKRREDLLNRLEKLNLQPSKSGESDSL